MNLDQAFRFLHAACVLRKVKPQESLSGAEIVISRFNHLATVQDITISAEIWTASPNLRWPTIFGMCVLDQILRCAFGISLLRGTYMHNLI
jgi:hypothetical protein